jgi:hypothetical protein
MQLSLDPTPRTKRYKVESATRLQQGGQVLEYHEVSQLELALLGTEKSSWIFCLTIQAVQTRGSNEVFTWARDVNALLDKLVFRVDASGRIAEVLNQAELLSRWPAHKQALQRAYGARAGAEAMLTALDQAVQTPGFLEKQLTANGLYDFLFPGLYGEYPSAGLPTSKTLRGFFGLLDLPLALRSQVEPAGTTGQPTLVRSVGQVDESRLDADGFRRFLKDATDRYDIKTDLKADYEATYQLDAQHWPLAADVFLAVAAGGTAYQYTLGRQLTFLL